MNISGINSLLFYKLNGKRILLLGEVHSSENWCDLNKKNAIDVD
jgi:hypothetical protein